MDQIKRAYKTYQSISEAHEHGYGLTFDSEQEFDTSSRIQIEKEREHFEHHMYVSMKDNIQSFSVAFMVAIGMEPTSANLISTAIRQIYDQSPVEKLMERVADL